MYAREELGVKTIPEFDVAFTHARVSAQVEPFSAEF
jgi:hypothetical protein